MFAWFYNNLATIIICAVLTGLVALILISKIKNKKTGTRSCDCANCPVSGSCLNNLHNCGEIRRIKSPTGFEGNKIKNDF